MRVVTVRLQDLPNLLSLDDVSHFRGPEGNVNWLLMNDQKGERCLVVGDVNPHETLFYLWLILEEKSEDPRERLKEMRAGKDALRATWRERALGGGVIGTDGKPVSWDSIHFEVSTPEEWRRILVAKLPLIVNWAFLGRPPIDDPDITLS